ncbi:MAG: xanthine dehydrogenase molybdenum-binding subunit XdhA [Firmicutes bacterium]|nr:xanthine dehydrogenase molybdenum-binding subunit XdhA [Bacillota bacterium]
MSYPDIIGKSVPRVDARDKVTGAAKYTADLCPAHALVARVLHSTVAHALVRSVDISEAAALPGVVKVVTCFDVPDIGFPTAGHPWSTEISHQDIGDRRMLNRHVRYVGDDVAAVVAVDEVAAARALRLIKVEYEELPAYTDVHAALAEGALPLHPEVSDSNIVKQHVYEAGDLAAVQARTDLRLFRRTYRTQPAQHCHIESATSFAWMEGGKLCIVCSTQLPHIVRRIVGQALGLPWGSVRVIKPYIGGGFGNKQDILYEPLNAWLSYILGGRCVRLEISREEVFTSTRQRHAEEFDYAAWVDGRGRLMGREVGILAQNGAYASHGHAICANSATVLRDIYQDELATRTVAKTVYTNTGTAGAMRGYGIPQACFAAEAMMDDIARELKLDPIEIRRINMMQPGFQDPGTGIRCNSYGLAECIEKGRALSHWDEKRAAYDKPQTGNFRRGIGMAIFTYKTGVYPISLETSSARMILNQDGSAQLQLGATEIGQGGDTVFCQMAAAASGLDFRRVHIVSCQDTDTAPFDTGAYASRQTYVTGKAIKLCGEQFRDKLLARASARFGGLPAAELEVAGDRIRRRDTGETVVTLEDLAQDAFYALDGSEHITAQVTSHCTDNTFAFGCCFAEIEVDLALGRVKVLDLINVHDSGVLINPALAAAQVEGGMSMGLGYALSEEMLYDDKGRLLNGTLLDYKLPTALDVPDLKAEFVVTDDPTGPFGNKALGEPPAIPVAPAIRNALLQATGVAFDTLPMDPKRLVAAFRERGLI